MSESGLLVTALSPVISSFKTLGIRHYVGGSVASSFHGAVRSTMDVDLVCELTDPQVTEFVHLLGDQYYYNESSIRDAVSHRAAFNLIHLSTSFKVDVFISRGRSFDVDALNRATLEQLGTGGALTAPVCTAEDCIISKLEWYRLGNELSERQWDDVTRLMALLGDRADQQYLKQAVETLGLSDLLNRLLGKQ